MRRSRSATDLYIPPPQNEYTYRSCCFLVDKRAAKFFSQLLLTLLMVGFCFYHITYGEDSLKGPMWALLGTFVGYWFDAPRIPILTHKTHWKKEV